MENQDVHLSISKDIVTPIVEAKIKQAVVNAFGGSEELLKKVVDQIITKKVDATGKVNNYSSENKYAWIDIAVTNTIQQEVEAAIKEHLTASAKELKEALVKHLRTKKGSELAAKALLDSLTGTFTNSWKSNISIQLTPLKDY